MVFIINNYVTYNADVRALVWTFYMCLSLYICPECHGSWAQINYNV